jgi:hypothetical protein
MNNNKWQLPENEEELVVAFDELFDEIPIPETEEEIDDYLRAVGYDPDEVAAHYQTLVQEALAASPLNWRNQRERLEQEQARLESTAATAPSNRVEILSAIEHLLSLVGGTQPVAAHFRSLDLEQVSDNDLAELLADLQYLVEQQSRNTDKDKE